MDHLGATKRVRMNRETKEPGKTRPFYSSGGGTEGANFGYDLAGRPSTPSDRV